MTRLTPRDRRLATELENMQKLVKDSSFVQFEARPEHLPEEYIVTFNCLSLISKPQWGPGPLPRDWRRNPPSWVGNSHAAHIYLPADYPRQPPQIRLVTPVYHPNIKHLEDSARELEELAERIGGIENLRRAFQAHPELQAQLQRLFASYVCIDGIIRPEGGGNYMVRSTLHDICNELGQMIMFQRYNLAHGLNDDAVTWTEWAEKQKNMLPIDNRPFLDKLPPVIRVIDISEELEIEVVD